MKSVEKVFLLLMVVCMMVPVVSAGMIGTDSFDYLDGSIEGQSGGTGWDAGGVSDWNVAWGGTAISGGTVTTQGGGVIREFGADEYAGAVQATGQVYFGVTMTVTADNYDWAGVSSFDFGNERIFFGCPGSQPDSGPTGMGYYGIDVSGDPGYGLTDISVVKDQAARIVGGIDFDGQQLLLWVNPDAGDYDNGGGDNSADLALAYTYTNWSSAVRLASGSAVGWDDLVVATDFATAVPEPTTLILLGAGTLLLRRKR